MIVYRKTEQENVTTDLMKEVAGLAGRAASTKRHEDSTELLIEMGRLEAGIVDAIFPDADGVNEQTAAARKASIIAGHAFIASWEGRGKDMASWIERLLKALSGLRSMPLPWKVKTRVPEGYAHYGLFPEVYAKSAADFFEAERPEEAVCVGLRSIGTSLSAVVAAILEEKGCNVRSFTLRPRSHPFRRKTRLTPMLEGVVKSMDCPFLLVDEGPGLSGTSFSSTAAKMASLGVPEEKIVIFPSWDPDGSSFISAEAKEVWARHRRYTASFEELWLKSGRLEKEAEVGPGLIDLSAGRWRTILYGRESDYPASHPRHEKRKYLSGSPNGEGAVLLKFAGHGSYGRKKLERAGRLADGGFAFRATGIRSGFLKYDFLPGRPLGQCAVNQLLLDQMAGYLAFLKRNFPAKDAMGFDEFAQMAERNIALGLGEEWAGKFSLGPMKAIYESGSPVEIDARMRPSEWVLTRKGYMKSDSVDHNSDQFFPACQDIAWDIASAVVEFDMSPMERNYFVSRYSAISGDSVGEERLWLHTAAYLAFRLGYSSFAARELAAEPDGQRFEALTRRYAARLRQEIARRAER